MGYNLSCYLSTYILCKVDTVRLLFIFIFILDNWIFQLEETILHSWGDPDTILSCRICPEIKNGFMSNHNHMFVCQHNI